MDRWIEETFHPHWRVRLKADRILHEVRTEHQHLVIFTNETWGTVLMLDGVTQLTTSDEFVYHEMMAHVPLMAMRSPKDVLVIGGGDGGVLREVLKHPSVERAVLVEIDRTVIDTALEHYPEIAGGAFDDKRTETIIADGLKFVADTDRRFDAIIVDSSEPIGPSAVLHTREFFADCKRALKPGGILVTQNGLPFHHPAHLGRTTEYFQELFANAAPYLCTQPCYFGGPFALNWASDDGSHLKVSRKKLARRAKKRGITTRYWTPAGHRGAFALPGYVAEAAASGDREAAAPAKDKRPRRARKSSSGARA
ncbi:MAG TPA: polyamine aminopropyltransferase [Hyphomicrobiaceae bacterium]|nr:polyamine aminopropyltransferase [Hyphomicrobiaceae bacterium]